MSRPTYLGGLGFGFKWNMGWMHDTLAYFEHEPIHRRWHHHELTFSLVYAFTENFILPLSHDEVVHGKGSMLSKMPGDRWQQLANLRALYAFMWAHPGKKLLFMGNEIAQEQEWSEERSLDWHLLENPGHSGVQSLVRDLNHAYRDTPALWERDYDHTAFWWLEPNDAEASVFAFARIGQDARKPVVFVANLTPVPRSGYRLGLPVPGRWTRARQHGLLLLRRLGPGQPRRRRGRGRPVDGPVPLGRADAAAARRRSGSCRSRRRATGPSPATGSATAVSCSHRWIPGALRGNRLAFAGPRRHRGADRRERLEAERAELEARPDGDRDRGSGSDLDDLLVVAVLPPHLPATAAGSTRSPSIVRLDDRDGRLAGAELEVAPCPRAARPSRTRTSDPSAGDVGALRRETLGLPGWSRDAGLSLTAT